MAPLGFESASSWTLRCESAFILMSWLFRKIGSSGFATMEFRLLIPMIALAFIGLDLIMGNKWHTISSNGRALSYSTGFADCSCHCSEPSLITLAKLILIEILLLK